jgi:hypothetical protein
MTIVVIPEAKPRTEVSPRIEYILDRDRFAVQEHFTCRFAVNRCPSKGPVASQAFRNVDRALDPSAIGQFHVGRDGTERRGKHSLGPS